MSKDTIYREDAIKAINARSDWYQVTCNGKQIAVMLMAKDVNEILKKIPSADRPQGEWIFKTVFPNDKSEFPMGYLVCSVCGSHHSNSMPCNYCDNCGAQMQGADDDL